MPLFESFAFRRRLSWPAGKPVEASYPARRETGAASAGTWARTGSMTSSVRHRTGRPASTGASTRCVTPASITSRSQARAPAAAAGSSQRTTVCMELGLAVIQPPRRPRLDLWRPDVSRAAAAPPPVETPRRVLPGPGARPFPDAKGIDMAYKYGRRPPKNAPALQLASFLRRAAPGAPGYPASEDYLGKLGGGWQMLGNDVAGDCNAVTWANMRRLVTAALATEYYPTQAQVWAFYQTQNPDFDPDGSSGTNGPGSSADRGMEIQTGLEYLHTTGGPDGVKAVAFAKVDHTQIAQVRAALAIFGGLWLGINVLAANQQEFADGQPWTDVRGSAIEGGHAILGGGYEQGVKFITWARETRL